MVDTGAGLPGKVVLSIRWSVRLRGVSGPS